VVEVVLIILAVTCGLWAAIELLLRVLLGFGNPLIYIADAECGYLLAPNQKVRRLGNRIEINEYSMRSPAIAPVPPPQTLRVLLVDRSDRYDLGNYGSGFETASTESGRFTIRFTSQLFRF
jgi:hypothetical protein